MAYGRREGFSYSDDVPIKISERMRIPTKITLPATFNPTITNLNLLEDEYDFSLEYQVIKLSEARRTAQEAKSKAEADKVAQQIEHFTQKQQLEIRQNDAPPVAYQPNQMLNPEQQPHPLRERSDERSCADHKRINLSDFETQSCSPFDYMELQTLNDLEELNTVFRDLPKQDIESTAETNSISDYNNSAAAIPTNELTCESPYSVAAAPPPALRQSYSEHYYPPIEQLLPKLRNSKSTSDISIVKNTNTLMESRSQTPPPIIIGQIKQVPEILPKMESHELCLPNPYEELDSDQKAFVSSLMDMGFPNDRASRAVKHLGTDDKKVLDHLCQVQGLEEAGYNGLDAETALHLYDYNREEAQKYLNLLVQFEDLGFQKSAVRKALVRHKNDRDKTLDFLLT